MASYAGRSKAGRVLKEIENSDAIHKQLRDRVSNNYKHTPPPTVEININLGDQTNVQQHPVKPIVISQKIVFSFIGFVFVCLLLLVVFDPLDTE